MERNEVYGTVTLSIADFDELTGDLKEKEEELEKKKKAFREAKDNFSKGLTTFVLPYYGYPYESVSVWLKPDEAIEKIKDAYEHKMRGIQDYTECNISKKSYWELIKWKREMNHTETS